MDGTIDTATLEKLETIREEIERERAKTFQNNHRIAELVGQAAETGLTRKELAAVLGKSETWVGAYVRSSKADESGEVGRRFRSHQINDPNTVARLTDYWKVNPKAVLELFEKHLGPDPDRVETDPSRRHLLPLDAVEALARQLRVQVAMTSNKPFRGFLRRTRILPRPKKVKDEDKDTDKVEE